LIGSTLLPSPSPQPQTCVDHRQRLARGR
jgi:hypothetical protein